VTRSFSAHSGAKAASRVRRDSGIRAIDAALARDTEPVDRERLRAALEQRIDDWKHELRGYVPQTRQLLRRMLNLPIHLTPEDGRTKGFEDIEWATGVNLMALAEDLVQCVASLEAVSSNQLCRLVHELASLRQFGIPGIVKRDAPRAT
jgi:hypothetical protein